MATQTVVTFVDDIDGSTENVEHYTFSWLGTDYEIDLAPRSAKKLVDVMNSYIPKAQKVSRSRGPRRARVSAVQSGSKDQLSAVRAWARSQGYQVSDRGRVAQAVKDAYDAAH